MEDPITQANGQLFGERKKYNNVAAVFAGRVHSIANNVMQQKASFRRCRITAFAGNGISQEAGDGSVWAKCDL